MKDTRSNKFLSRRITVFSLVAFLATGLIMLCYFFFFEAVVEDKINDALMSRFHGRYKLKYQTMDYRLGFKSIDFKLTNILLTTDSSVSNQRYLPTIYAHIDELNILEISLYELLKKDKLLLSSCLISNSNIEITPVHNSQNISTSSSHLLRSKNALKSIGLDKVSILNSRLIIKDFNSTSDLFSYQNTTLHIKNPEVVFKDKHGIPFHRFSNLYLLTDSMKIDLPGFDFIMLAGRTEINYLDNVVHLQKFQLQPRNSYDKSDSHERYQKTFMKLALGDVQFYGLDKDLLLEGHLKADSINLIDADLNLFRNISKPLTKKTKPLLLEKIEQIHSNIYLPKIKFVNSHLLFELKKSSAHQKNMIVLNQLNGSIYNFHTGTYQSDSLKLSLRGKIFDNTSVEFESTMYRKSSNIFESYSGRIGKMKLLGFNKLMESLTHINFTSGSVKDIIFSGNSINRKTRGRLTFRYNDLTVEIDKKNHKKRNFLSALVNLAVVNNNPKHFDSAPYEAHYMYRNPPEKGHVMLWLGGLFYGVEKTVIPILRTKK